MKEFAVTSSSFALYKAFKEEAEKEGWNYYEGFTRFRAEVMDNCDSLYFSDEFNGKDSGLTFAFSNHSGTEHVFSLEKDWIKAIEFLKNFKQPPLNRVFISIQEIAYLKGCKVDQLCILP